MVFFDLPVLTKTDKRAYSHFRKFLVKNGFMMMQESVYCKLVLNHSSANAVVDILKRNKPEKGKVLALTITEKQYSKIDYIVGEEDNDVVNSDQRTVIL